MKKIILVFGILIIAVAIWLGLDEYRLEKKDSMMQMEVVQSVRREFLDYVSVSSGKIGGGNLSNLTDILNKSLSEIGYKVQVDRQHDDQVSAFAANEKEGVSFRVELSGDGSVSINEFKWSR